MHPTNHRHGRSGISSGMEEATARAINQRSSSRDERSGHTTSRAAALLAAALLCLVACSQLATAAPLAATWVSLSPLAASPTDGIPERRCDHSLFTLSGAASRPNAAFPSAASGSADPYAGRVWLLGGHGEDGGFAESWELDTTTQPQPTWTKLQYNAASNPAAPVSRWGQTVSLLPSGLRGTAEVGVTALIWGGAGDEGYLGDMSSLNFGTETWTEVIPQPAVITDEAPFPRGYAGIHALPVGFGTGHVAPDAPDSGSFYFTGGLGAADGVPYSDLDTDWNDEWIFNATSLTWSRLGTLVCVKNETVCSDEMTIASVLANYTGEDGGGAFDLNTTLRPSEIQAALSRLSTALSANSARTAALADAPNACQIKCTKFNNTASDPSGAPNFKPPPMEGVRMARIGSKGYLFGGYICGANGKQEAGGEACFLGSMYILDYATMRWNISNPPPNTHADFALWPSQRCYNTLVAHESRGLIIVQGGFYQDITGVGYYYSDSYAFDVNLGTFVPFIVRGVPPLVQWSGAAALVGDSMYVHGGCQGANYWDQLSVLRIGLAIRAENCEATGAGLSTAVAGTEASFAIQIREFTRVVNQTFVDGVATNVTSIAFGAVASYGAGLLSAFSVQLVSSSSNGALSLLPATVTEVGAGLYTCTYTASVGRSYRLFVLFEGLPIPGSPFQLTLEPELVVGPALSKAQGLGIALVQKGALASLRIQAADRNGNAYTDGKFLASTPNVTEGWRDSDPLSLNVSWPTADGGAFALSAAIGPSAASTSPIAFAALNYYNGSFGLRYAAPKGAPSFVLRIFTNGQDITGSPFTVEALNDLSLASGLVIALWVVSFLVIALCLVASAFVHHWRAESVMRSSSPNFLHLLILGSVLSALSVVFLAQEGSDSACQAFHTLLSVGIILGMAALLAKSNRVMRIFNAKVLKVQSNLSDAHLLIPTLGVTAAMLLLNLLWIGLYPQRSEARPSSTHPDVLSFNTCSSEKGSEFVWAIIAFCGVVLIYGLKIAVATSHVPSQFNESKMIAASVYNVFFCSVIVVPLTFFLGSSSEFFVGRIVLQSLVILWCSLFNVAALIMPKVLLLLNLFQQGPTGLPTTNHGSTVYVEGRSEKGEGGGTGAGAAQPVSGMESSQTREHSTNGGTRKPRGGSGALGYRGSVTASNAGTGTGASYAYSSHAQHLAPPPSLRSNPGLNAPNKASASQIVVEMTPIQSVQPQQRPAATTQATLLNLPPLPDAATLRNGARSGSAGSRAGSRRPSASENNTNNRSPPPANRNSIASPSAAVAPIAVLAADADEPTVTPVLQLMISAPSLGHARRRSSSISNICGVDQLASPSLHHGSDSVSPLAPSLSSLSAAATTPARPHHVIALHTMAPARPSSEDAVLPMTDATPSASPASKQLFDSPAGGSRVLPGTLDRPSSVDTNSTASPPLGAAAAASAAASSHPHAQTADSSPPSSPDSASRPLEASGSTRSTVNAVHVGKRRVLIHKAT